MTKEKLIIAGILFILGFAGILSLLTMEVPLPEEAEAALREIFSPRQIRLLILINPTIMLVIAVIIGVVLYDRVHLTLPLFEKLAGKRAAEVDLAGILKFGVSGGVVAGLLMIFTALLFSPHLPEEFTELGEELQLSLAGRFLYGGITEEILMRFGLMTFLVWAFSLVYRSTGAVIYWSGILIAAFLFAIAHLPVVFTSVDDPTITLMLYVLLGNSIGGIVFGWLYWKKGLESAFLAHIFAHVVMVAAEPFVNG